MNKIAGSGIDYGALSTGVANKIGTNPLGSIISTVLPLVLTVAGFILLFYLIFSGFQYLMSGGDPKAIQQAKLNLTYAVVGFVVVLGSYLVVQLVAGALQLTPIISIFP